MPSGRVRGAGVMYSGTVKKWRQEAAPCVVRWIHPQDMDQIQWIEERSFDHAWTPEEFGRVNRCRNTIAQVAVDPKNEKLILGYFFYELTSKSFSLLNMAVAPEFR